MTLGEKIRCARKCGGLSQGQLAEKLCVSRSAVAKWETDKGLPDVENLKLLARLLQVSVDSLLDDGEGGAFGVIRQPIALSDWGRGCGKVKKDRLMREKFPGAEIRSLMGRPELDQAGHTVDRSRGFLTSDPFGVPEYRKSIREENREFYLIEREGEQFFVSVTDTCLEIRPMEERVTGRQFRLGEWRFVFCEFLPEI